MVAILETLRVLLIERDRDRTERVRHSLRHSPLARFQLDLAGSPDTVVSADGTTRPDVVVLDIRDADGNPSRRIEEVRRAFPTAALVLVGDVDGVHDSPDVLEADGYIVDCDEERVLDRVAVAAAVRKRRALELQRRVHDLEVGERNLRTLVSTTSDGIMIVDMDGCICFANPAAQRLFGRDAGELIGEPFGFPLVTGESTMIDIVRRGGHERVVELLTTPTRWEGQLARLAALRDVTERVKAEQHERELVREHTRRMEAEQSERRTRLLSEATRLLASTLDSTRALDDLVHLVVPDLADCCLIDLVEPDAAFRRIAVATHGDAASLLSRMRAGTPRFHTAAGPAKALRLGEPWTAADCVETEFLDALGLPEGDAPFPPGAAHATLLPLIARDEPVGAMLLIHYRDRAPLAPPDLLLVREIAQRAAVAIDHSRLYQQSQEAAQAKADFLAVMSHELRTPLNAIIGYAELLTLGVPAELPDESREQVRRIRSSAGHLLRLINEILSFSSLEDGRAELDLQTTDIRRLVTEVVAMLQPLADRRGLALDAAMPDDSVSLDTDPHKLRQILLNLVSNAIKVTDYGAVTVRLRTELQDAVIDIHDTGCGIAPADIDRIFHPFWQAEHSRTRRAEGTGLGLTVARRLAHLLAGEITVDSEPGEGSVFTLRLPWRYPRNRRPARRRARPH